MIYYLITFKKCLKRTRGTAFKGAWDALLKKYKEKVTIDQPKTLTKISNYSESL